MAPVNRKLRAQETRARIAAAAGTLFAERGYQGTPMSAVAQEAGVAVQTVYFAFRTKAELLVAAFDQAVLGSLDAPRPDQQEWSQRVLIEPDCRRAIQLLVDGAMDILVRAGPLLPVMVTSPDEEVREAFRHREQGRYEGWRQVIQSLARNGGLRPGLDEAKATDILFVMLSPSMHSMLCVTQGWTREEFRRWMIGALQDQLLGPAPTGPSVNW